MKELSIEEKAKRYDEAIKVAKSKIKNDKDHVLYENDILDIFPELNESEHDRIRKCITLLVNGLTNEHFVRCGASLDEIKVWLEKQGEQKPANKVESKFKVGDWVACNNENLRSPLRVVSISDKEYRLEDTQGGSAQPCIEYLDKHYHFWTIQDANDGDVLATKDIVFIFKHMDKTGLSLCKSYCEVVGNSKLGLGFDFSINGVHPATKEQCDLLFQKMKEAGYEWDAEKKELKKIEQKPDNKVKSTTSSYITPNPEFFRWIYDRLKYVHNENPDVDYMRSLRERIENMQKPDWSEEDEKMKNWLVDELQRAGHPQRYYDAVKWLKSFKLQNTEP